MNNTNEKEGRNGRDIPRERGREEGGKKTVTIPRLIFKSQLRKFLEASSYQMNKYFVPPALRIAMGLTAKEYRLRQHFTKAEFKLIVEFNQFTEEEIYTIINTPK